MPYLCQNWPRYGLIYLGHIFWNICGPHWFVPHFSKVAHIWLALFGPYSLFTTWATLGSHSDYTLPWTQHLCLQRATCDLIHLGLFCYYTCRPLQAVPILGFWGPYAKLWCGGVVVWCGVVWCGVVGWGGVGGGGGGMDETHLSVFHSVSNRARGRRSRNSISSRYAFNLFFCFFSNKRLYDIHVTRFLHRECDSAPH